MHDPAVAAVKAIRDALVISERQACTIAKCNRRMFRYKSRRVTDDAPLRKRLEELAAERRRFGLDVLPYFCAARGPWST
jgi:putative transposase